MDQPHDGLLSNTPVPEIILDSQDKIIEYNHATVKILGTQRLKHLLFTDFISGTDRQVFSSWRTGLDPGKESPPLDITIATHQEALVFIRIFGNHLLQEKKEYFLRLLLFDLSDFHNQTTPVLAKPYLDRDKNQKLSHILRNEIKLRKSIEIEKQSEHHFRRSIEEVIPAGIAVISSDGKLMYANRTLCQMLGYPSSELLGASPPYPFWPDEEKEERMANFYTELEEGGKDFQEEARRYMKKNGEMLWCLRSCLMIKNQDGENMGILKSLIDISKRVEAESRLVSSEKKLKKLSQRIIGAQEEERKRISKELHDSIGSSLTAVKFALERLISGIPEDENPMQNTLSMILEMVKSISTETRRISKNLHPAILDDLGLCAALRSHFRQFMELHTDIHVEPHLQVHENHLDDNMKLLIYRLIQESLHNVAKHSQADMVRVVLRTDADTIFLEVEDNGIGFEIQGIADTQRTGKSMGMSSLRERTELFGGEIQIHSEKGKGTLIKAFWTKKPL